MKLLLSVLGVGVAVAILLIVVHRWKNVEPLSVAQRAIDEGLAADEHDIAIAKFTEAIRLQPDGAEAYLHRGDAYKEKDDLDRAVADFSNAIRLNPDFAEAYQGRGGVYRNQGQSEKAKADFQRFDELSDPEAVRLLFKKHIPEIANGVVEIKGVARIGGARTKIAVYSPNARIDALSSCVGPNGTRIKNIVDELKGERIDIVRWTESLQVMIPNALQPAHIDEVFLYQLLGRAIVLVKKDQLSLAIGQRGQNVRLASKLIGWTIELLTTEELNAALGRAENWFRQIPGVGDDVVNSFIDGGLLSYEDLASVETAQLAGLAGVTQERAAAMILFAKRAAARNKQQDLERRGLKKR